MSLMHSLFSGAANTDAAAIGVTTRSPFGSGAFMPTSQVQITVVKEKI